MLVTALATPFKDNKTDVRSYRRLVESQIGYADALLALGTTAEAQLLSDREKTTLVRLAAEYSPDTPLWVGVGDSDTRRAARSAKLAAQWGAYGILLAPPSFVKCTPQGFVRHVLCVAEASELPIMLYNAPSRCGYELDPSCLERLTKAVPFLKDAGGANKTAEYARYATVLCGNECLLKEMFCRGAQGIVSVVSNIAPRLTKKVAEKSASQKERETFETLARLAALEVNPIAIKYMLFKKGIFDTFDVRLPLTNACAATRAAIDEIFGGKL